MNLFSLNLELCCGCGTCYAMCPHNAIDFNLDKKKGIYLPKLNENCSNCSICLKICPIINKQQYHNTDAYENFIGSQKQCYIGNSTNPNIRFNSSSGGLVTSILIFALENGIIDGALVTKMSKSDPSKPEPFIARTEEEIIEASQSKYCPVPANIALKEILNTEGEHFAIVGLPCHLQAIENAQRVNMDLQKKIVLKLGIFCSHNITFKGNEFFFKKNSIDKDKILEMFFRGEGWPGKMKIISKNKELIIENNDPKWNTTFNSLFFAPTSCIFCEDLTAESSDISFGDPWLPEYINKETKGKSLIISRTETGENLLKLMKTKERILYDRLNPIEIIKSQKIFLHFKKTNIKYRLKFKRHFKNNNDYMFSEKTTAINYLSAFLTILNNFTGKHINFLLDIAPFKLLHYYTFLYLNIVSKAAEKDFKNLNKKEYSILIVNAHWNNRGDEAAIRAMIDSLRSNLDAKIKLMILLKKITFFPYDNVELIESFPYSENNKLNLLLNYFDVLISVMTFGKIALTKKGKKFISLVDEADIIVHAPGGPSIGDLYSGAIIEYSYLYRLLIPILKNKKIFFYAPSMGPFTGKIKNNIRKFVLKKSNKIVVRDKISSDYLKEQLDIKSIVTLDSAFQNEIPITYLLKYPELNNVLNYMNKKKTVGMTLTDLKWHPSYKRNKKMQKKIIKDLSILIKNLILKGYFIILIPQLFGNTDKNETKILEYFKSIDKNNIFILPPNIDSYGQQLLISKLYFLIGMRYHPNIFAAKMNIPSIALIYEHKTEGFMKELQREDMIIKVEEMNSSILLEKVSYLEENYNQIKNQITYNNTRLKKKSMLTSEILIKKLKQ